MSNSIGKRIELMFTVILCGALWGLAEATVGYGLHLLQRLIAIPPVAGFIMFPIGVLFMFTAVIMTGRPATAVFVAGIAAAIKASSALLPSVSWIFVQNPIIAILMQGLVVWGLATTLGFGRTDRPVIVPAVVAGTAWRGAFVLIHVAFAIRWGLLSRGAGAVTQFLLLDSMVNAVFIVAMVKHGLPVRLGQVLQKWARPAPVGLALFGALLAEIGFRLV